MPGLYAMDGDTAQARAYTNLNTEVEMHLHIRQISSNGHSLCKQKGIRQDKEDRDRISQTHIFNCSVY